MNELHVVCGAPGAGKTTYATQLARELGAAIFDSDQVTQRLVQAGLALAGLDVNDRDSPAYKKAYRDCVYETLWDLAVIHGEHLPVVVAGPFTSECGELSWPDKIYARTGKRAVIWFVQCPAEIRKQRIVARGETRDEAKLLAWDEYRTTCREETPVFPCQIVSNDNSLSPSVLTQPD